MNSTTIPSKFESHVHQIANLSSFELINLQPAVRTVITEVLSSKEELDKYCASQDDTQLIGNVAENLWAFLLIEEGYRIIYIASQEERQFPIDVISIKNGVYYLDQVKNYTEDVGARSIIWNLRGFDEFEEFLEAKMNPYDLKQLRDGLNQKHDCRRLISWRSGIAASIHEMLDNEQEIDNKTVNGFINRALVKVVTTTSIVTRRTLLASVLSKRWGWQPPLIEKCFNECCRWNDYPEHPGWWIVAPPGSGKTSRIIFGAIDKYIHHLQTKPNIGIIETQLSILASQTEALIKFMTENGYKRIVNTGSRNFPADVGAALTQSGIEVVEGWVLYDEATVYCLTAQGIYKHITDEQVSKLPILGIAFFDECHHYVDDEETAWVKAIWYYQHTSPRTMVVACTATPWRRDWRDLHTHFCHPTLNPLGRPVQVFTIEDGMRPQEGVNPDTAYLAPNLIWRLFDKEIRKTQVTKFDNNPETSIQTLAKGFVRALLNGMQCSRLPYFKIEVKINGKDGGTALADQLCEYLRNGWNDDYETQPGIDPEGYKVFVLHGKRNRLEEDTNFARMMRFDATRNPQGLTFGLNSIKPNGLYDRLVGIFIVVDKYAEGTNLIDLNVVVPTFNMGQGPRGLQFITRACRRDDEIGKDTWEVWDLDHNLDTLRLIFPETTGIVKKQETKHSADSSDIAEPGEASIFIIDHHPSGVCLDMVQRIGEFTRRSMEAYYKMHREKEVKQGVKNLFAPSARQYSTEEHDRLRDLLHENKVWDW